MKIILIAIVLLALAAIIGILWARVSLKKDLNHLKGEKKK